MIPNIPIIIPRRAIPGDAVVKRTIDVAERLTTLTEWHHEYLSGQRVPLLPPAEEVKKELEVIVGDPAFGYDQRVAEAASFISAALVGERYDGKDAERLPYLGKAIVLAAESERGRTNEVAFQDVVRYLLAKNGYTPIRTQEYGEHSLYHFYTDQPGTKVVAISEEGVKIYCAELKSAFGLDELVEDFLNLKRGKNAELAKYESGRKVSSFLIPACCGVAGFSFGFPLLLFSGLAPQYVGVGAVFSLSLVGSYIGYKLAKFTHAKISEHRYQQKLQQEQAKFPQQTLTSGVYALIDAFPLEKNVVVEKK